MANLLSLNKEFPHSSKRDCDVLVSSLFLESLTKIVSAAMALSNSRGPESPVELFYNPFTPWRLKLSRGSIIYIF